LILEGARTTGVVTSSTPVRSIVTSPHVSQTRRRMPAPMFCEIP
jgi:hypothetical protein